MRKTKQFILLQVERGQLAKADAFDLLRELTEAEQAPALPSAAPAPVAAASSDIAVVGMSCRFPHASTPDEFWQNLKSGDDAVGPYPRSRMLDFIRVKRELWNTWQDKVQAPDADQILGGWLPAVDTFDGPFFGLSRADALTLGPAERLFLETAWEAFEGAGFTRASLRGSRTGVYLAHSPEVPFEYCKLLPETDPQAVPFNNPGATGYRLSYWLDLRGPTAVVNTTCSSSLVACHVAMQALRAGDCDVALAGGISLFLFPYLQDTADPMRLRSPDGRCKAFDASADGLSMGEGLGLVVLKRLADAQRDGDFIHGVIKGSAINSDGRSNGITAPNPTAQTDVVVRAWSNAGVDPETISYIEAHGAGTQLGDPVEVKGLTDAFRRFTTRKGFCGLGSVKTNISHLGDTSGVAGLIKVLLSLRHQTLPGSLHFRKPNPLIPFAESPLFVSAEQRPWEPACGIRRAGVSSFGISGTNCHLVVEEAPRAPATPIAQTAQTARQTQLLPLSARSLNTLWQLLARYESFLDTCPESHLEALCQTAAFGRDPCEYRVAILATSVDELRQKVARLGRLRHLERLPDTFPAHGIYAARVAAGVSERYSSLPPAPGAPTDMRAAALAWLTRPEVKWDAWLSRESWRKLPLPVSCFDNVRLWPDHEVPEEEHFVDLFFDLRWVEAELAQRGVPRTDGIWLLLGDEGALCDSVVERLRAAGAPAVVVVRADESFAKLGPDLFAIDPSSGNDYLRLLEAVKQARPALPLAGILHLWSCRPADDAMESLEALMRSQELAALSTFRLAKALHAHALGLDADFFVAAAYAHAVDGSEPALLPARVTGFGFTKVLSQELPAMSACGIDVDLTDTNHAACVEAIFAELGTPRRGRAEAVAWRHGRRWVQQLARMPAPAGAPAHRIRDGGVYVIAGGTGYLGIQMGQSLVSQAKNVKLVLLSRSGMPPRERWDELRRSAVPGSTLEYQLAGVKAMEESGAEVLTLQADVTDPLELEAALARARKRFGRISGLFVAMKQLYHKPVKDLADEEFRTGLMNRVRGTWLLDSLTREDDLDFIVLLSSISSILGTRTASECCAVNQFLDAYAPFGRAHGRQISSLNLTLILDDRRDFRGPTPIPPLDFRQFKGCFEHFLGHQPPLAVVARFDAAEVSYLLPVLRVPFAPELLVDLGVSAARQQAESLPATPVVPIAIASAELEARLRALWKEILGEEPRTRDDGFFALGGTSLTALKLVQVVRQSFGVAFEPADVFANPTIGGMIRCIAEQLAPAVDPLASVLDGVESGELSVEAALSALRNSGR